MDDHGQIGPEKGDYAADCVAVAHALQGGSVWVALTDKGTRLGLLLTRRRNLLTPPDGRGPDGVPKTHSPYVHVAVENHRNWWLRIDGYQAPDYLASKLDVTRADGETLGEFFTRLHLALTNTGTERSVA